MADNINQTLILTPREIGGNAGIIMPPKVSRPPKQKPDSATPRFVSDLVYTGIPVLALDKGPQV